LQGEAIPLTETTRGGFGNSKVLAPELRDPRSAYLVTRWLIEKAASRLRRDNYVASSFSLQIGRENAAPLGRSISCAQTQDTSVFLRINKSLWRQAWPYLRGQKIMTVSVQLGKVDLLERRNGDLLRALPAATRTKGERAAAAVDFINGRFGPGSITYGINVPHPGFFERG
jgi:DNA polymerase-4